ncbi:hypothetical protein HY632_00375 [Candidatus Uhrbacteria bacterium]|nr:hypothetical protein [Candidatus Uhrbacteria bacterium]
MPHEIGPISHVTINAKGAVATHVDSPLDADPDTLVLTLMSRAPDALTVEQRAAAHRVIPAMLHQAMDALGAPAGYPIPNDTVVTVRTADHAHVAGAHFLACYRGTNADGHHLFERLGQHGQRALSFLRPAEIDQLHAHPGHVGLTALALLEAEMGELTVDAFTGLVAAANPEGFADAVLARALSVDPLPVALAVAAMPHIRNMDALKPCMTHRDAALRQAAITHCTDANLLMGCLLAMRTSDAFTHGGHEMIARLQGFGDPTIMTRFLAQIPDHWGNPFSHGTNANRLDVLRFYNELFEGIPEHACVALAQHSPNAHIRLVALHRLLDQYPNGIDTVLAGNLSNVRRREIMDLLASFHESARQETGP